MNQSKRDVTSAVVDGILKLLAAGTLVATILVTPNAVQALDKPLKVFFDKMDERARQREWRRILAYMKNRQLISYASNYKHGVKITKAGRQRAAKANFAKLSISKPKKWDKKWRLVFFDIPETSKKGRDALVKKLRSLGFYQLQRSAWIHPFPCRKIIETIAAGYEVDRFVTYIKTSFIDNQIELQKRFKHLLRL